MQYISLCVEGNDSSSLISYKNESAFKNILCIILSYHDLFGLCLTKWNEKSTKSSQHKYTDVISIHSHIQLYDYLRLVLVKYSAFSIAPISMVFAVLT